MKWLGRRMKDSSLAIPESIELASVPAAADQIDEMKIGASEAVVAGGASSKELIGAARIGEPGCLPPWREQITARGLVAAAVVGVIYSVIVMKLVLTTGLVPTLNVSAALVAFVLLRSWTHLIARLRVAGRPFSRQENTVVQTCAVACYSLASGGGFGSYLLGLNKRTYEQAGVGTAGNVPGSYKEPAFWWMAGFLLSVSFIGLFALIPLRKILIIDYKLTYPSGTATAVLINGFHTVHGDKTARKQVHGFAKFFGFSFLWSFFQWFYSGGDRCGFSQFPTFGLQAWEQSFFFDFSLTYVGAGMICSHLVNASLMIGAILSWGVMWPLIGTRKGDWYPATLPESSMRSLQGYKTFLSISLILGDGLYHFIKILAFTARSLLHQSRRASSKKVVDEDGLSLDDLLQNEVFLKDSIPDWLTLTGYLLLAAISVIAIPSIFPEMRWYYVVVAGLLAPVLCFSNAYGTGLTDINMAYNYGKVALFILAASVGGNSGVVAGLVGCGLIKSMVMISGELMQDLKTGHLTFTSPRAMLAAQAIGTAMGCIIAPLTFLLFYNAFDIGNTDSVWKAPYALIYRNMAILGVEGFTALPSHCLQLCYGLFGFAVVASALRDVLPARYARIVPLPMAMAVPFLVGASFAIDMCVGSLVVFVWHKVNSARAAVMVPAVASGLICGDGMWTFPSAILALAKITPPICMKFMAAQ